MAGTCGTVDLLVPAPANRNRKVIIDQDSKLPDDDGPGNGPFRASETLHRPG